MSVPVPHIEVQDLTMAYGDFIIQRNLNFTINRGDIFIIMGGSGCGKSTLLRHLVGLKSPAAGRDALSGRGLLAHGREAAGALMQRIGVLYQSGALWSSMTLAENVALPLGEYTDLSAGRSARSYPLNWRWSD